MRRAIRSTLSALVMGMSAQAATADAVTERMKQAMKECVIQNASRIGDPIGDTDQWSSVVAGSTVVAFSMVKMFGLQGEPDIQEAIKLRAGNTLISVLEEKGLKGFRSQALETINHCLPPALVAAASELERQKTAACPDDTSYRRAVAIVTASESELRTQYGEYAADSQENALLMIEAAFIQAFPEIFRYGREEYSEFSDADYKSIHSALEQINASDMMSNKKHIDDALTGIRGLNGEQSDRVKAIQRELTCVKDWLDIYPADEIDRLNKK